MQRRSSRLSLLPVGRFCAVAAAAVVALGASAAAQAETIYKVTELLIGPKSDVTLYSTGRAINKGGRTAVEYGYTVSGFAAAPACGDVAL